MADKRISQLIERTNIANNDVLPIVASGATTTNKVTISSIQTFMQSNLDVGVTSVGLSMPSAFVVSASPVTSSGNISVTGAGTVAQYIRGDGSLADFPSGGGGGGSSVNYYLNGSVSQGTIGGIAYQEMNKTPVLGAGTDFTIAADGYIASFITDAGDPALLEIPAGNWNFETYLQASSGGGTPSFYIELYKVNSGGTATLIASNSATPELIAFGTTTTPYFSALAVPTTSLTLTDRLALRYYVTHSGRTITLHTENSNLCQIITTFTTGLTALNGLTAQVQNFATGTSGTDFAISSSVSTHTFNLPDASASARGVVTTGTQTFAGYKIFTGTISANNDIQLAAAGTASTTFIKNISGAGLTSVGSNGFGFNNSDNIYFSGSNKGGGIIAFSNTGNQTYTLQDASGTLAFTSDIPSLAGYVTLATTQTITGAKTFDTTTSNFLILNSTNASGGALTFRRNGTNVGHIGNSGVLGVGILDDLEVRSGIGKGLHLKTDGGKLTLSSGGSVTLDGALNGTSASFSGAVNLSTSTGNVGIGTLTPTDFGSTYKVVSIDAAGGGGVLDLMNTGVRTLTLAVDGGSASIASRVSGNSLVFITNNAGTIAPRLTLASTGAATFSSSVATGGTMFINGDDNSLYQRALTSNASIYWDIRNSANTRRAYLGFGSASSSVFDLWNSENGAMVFGTNNTERMRITSTGNVGIGVTPSAWDTSILRGLQIGTSNPAFFVGRTDAVSQMQIGVNAYYDGTWKHFATNAATRYYQGGGEHYWDSAVSDSANSTVAWVERMRITSGGEVLVGTQTTDVNTVGCQLRPFGLGIFVRSGASTLQLNRTSSDGIIASFRTSDVERGSISIAGSTTSYNTTSDYRLKEDFQEIKGLEKVGAIKVYDYKWKLDEKRMDGVLAHELAEVLPYAVFGEKDEVDEDGNDRMQSVDYSKIVPIMIKAIQELKTEIDSLKNQIK